MLFFATLAVILAIIGWSLHEECLSISEILYRSFVSLLLSGIYEKGSDWNHSAFIDAARWCALVFFVIGATKAIRSIALANFLRWKARTRSHHVIVVGDNPLAQLIAAELGKNRRDVTWLGAPKDFNILSSSNILAFSDPWSLDTALSFGIKNADSLVIVSSDDAQSVTIAKQVRGLIPEEKDLSIFVSVDDQWLATRIDELDGITGIHMFSRARAAVRRVNRRHPPFLIADKLKQEKVHVVIMGYGLYGEALLVDVVLSCLNTKQGKPLVTIVDPDAERIENTLRFRYPEMSKSVDIHFCDKALDEDFHSLSTEELDQIAACAPVTATYIGCRNETRALNAALALQAYALRSGWGEGPIITRDSDQKTLLEIDAGVSHLKASQLIGFADLEGVAHEIGILESGVDSLARANHEAYRRKAEKNSPANVPWEKLTENMRNSNRCIVMHIAAKLYSANFGGLEDWILELDDRATNESLPYFPELQNDQDMILQIAKLEHERWMAEKRINGYCLGERDDLKRFHPDLVPFDSLNDRSKSYDVALIDDFARLLARE